MEGLRLRNSVVFGWAAGGAAFGAVALALLDLNWTFPTAAFVILGFLLAVALYVHDLQKLQFVMNRDWVQGHGVFHWLGRVAWKDVQAIEERVMRGRKVVDLATTLSPVSALNSDLRVLLMRRRWSSAGKITLSGDVLQGGHEGLLRALRAGWEASQS